MGDEPTTPTSVEQDFWGAAGAQTAPDGASPARPPTAPAAGGDASKGRGQFVKIGIAVAVVGVAGGVIWKATSQHATAVTTTNAATSGPAPGANTGGANGRRLGGGTAGTLKSVNGSSLVVTATDGSSVTVKTSSTTTIEKSVTGSIGDVKVGDNVVATGSSTGADALTAQRVVDSGTLARDGGPGGGGFRPPANGQAPAGAPDGTGTGTAGGTAPPAGPGGFGGAAGGFAAGKVTSINGATLVITGRDGTTTTTVDTTGATITVLRPSTLKDLKIGDQTVVRGTTATDGSVTATSVQQGGLGGGFGGGFGGRRGGGGAGTGSAPGA